MTPSKLMEDLGIEGDVIAILKNEQTGLRRVYLGKNIITDAGDTYYAQRACGETPTNAFDTLWLGTNTGSAAPGKTSDSDDIAYITGSAKAVKATYPKTNDADADNTGEGPDVVTWIFEYAAGDFNNTDIGDGMIGVGAHAAAEPALNHFTFSGAPFSKTASDTLKVIVNHTFTGA